MSASRLHSAIPGLHGIAILLLTLTLAACGFQLRGDYTLAPGLSPVYVDKAGPYELRAELRAQLRANGVALAKTASLAASSLKILSSSQGRRVLSVDVRGRAREYALDYTILYQFRYNGKDSLERELKLSRDLLFDPDSVLAINTEIETL